MTNSEYRAKLLIEAANILGDDSEVLEESIFGKFKKKPADGHVSKSYYCINKMFGSNSQHRIYKDPKEAVLNELTTNRDLDKDKKIIKSGWIIKEIIRDNGKKIDLNAKVDITLYEITSNNTEKRAQQTIVKKFNTLKSVLDYIGYTIDTSYINFASKEDITKIKSIIALLKKVPGKPKGFSFSYIEKNMLEDFIENEEPLLEIGQMAFNDTMDNKIIDAMSDKEYHEKANKWYDEIINYSKKLNIITNKYGYKIDSDWDKYEGYMFIKK